MTDHVSLYVIVKALGDELCRRYGAELSRAEGYLVELGR